MSDERLRRNLQAIDGPAVPDSAFVDDLHAVLAQELGLAPMSANAGRIQPTLGSRRRGRRWFGWLAVAALVLLAIGALVLGPPGRAPVVPAPSSMVPTVVPTGSLLPTESAPLAPTASLIPSLGALRGDGLVVFEVGDITEQARLRVLRPDLTSVELLPDQPGLQRRATWNPDGSRIAFGVHDLTELRSRALIWETDAEGSEPRLLSEGCDLPACVEENDPGYSPDGKRLVFVRTREAEGDPTPVSVIAIRDLQSGEVTELEATSRSMTDGANYHPRWSPDGQTIAYAVAAIRAEGGTAGSTIRLVGGDGASDRALTPPELEAGDPEWAPDGASLLFSSQPIRVYAAENDRHPDRMHLYTMQVDGSDVRQLPVDGPVGAAAWTTSGEQILFTYVEAMGDISPGHPRLFVIDADGSNVLPITSSIGTAAWYAVQQPVP
jgi:hypothetical protein